MVRPHMGLYERHVCPPLTELILRSGHTHEQRARLLAGVGGRVLEIGFGTGLNLQHYDRSAVERLDVVDPAEGMHARARARVAASPLEVHSHVLGAERLPFDDDCFDAVVCTFTLCTIPDPVQAAVEVRRVLRPGAALHVLEHVGSIRPQVRRWQERLNPVQRLFGCGCNLDRDVDAILEAGGFAQRSIERFDQPKTLALYREHVRGTATK